MKKVICLVLIFILCHPLCAMAKDSYITLEPYPYSSHVLGESLVIYGDTDFDNVTLGLSYPNDEQGYMGYAKYVITITAKELKAGYVIETDTYSRLWPEGDWTVVVQYGSYRDEITVKMTKEPVYNRYIRIAGYEANALTSLTTYPCRGMQFKNNVLEFTTTDNICIRIFSWNNLSPASDGTTRLFITTSKDGYMTDIKTFTGELTDYGNHTSIVISPTERLEILYWDNNFTPVQ